VDGMSTGLILLQYTMMLKKILSDRLGILKSLFFHEDATPFSGVFNSITR